MPVLYTKFLQPQNVPLFIKGLLPSSCCSRTTTNFFLLCSVTITLVVAFIYFLRRPGRRWNDRPALDDIADKNEKWKNPTAAVQQEDYEKHRYRLGRTRSSSLLSRPKNTGTGTNNKVNFKIEEEPVKETLGDQATLNTSTPLSPKFSNPDLQLLQRRRSSTNKGLSTTPYPTPITPTTTIFSDTTNNEMALEAESAGNEEIVVAEGWTRHTRVYGGGVCQACVESEERMRALGLSLGSADQTGDGGRGGDSSESAEGGQGKGDGGS